MDRSSMRVVQTDDHEKRLAFKEKLAAKLDSPEQVTIEPTPEPAFVSVGQQVSYPGLGNGTVSFVGGNELVIQFTTGPIPMDLSLAKRFLSILPEAKADKWNDAFIGDVIERPVLDRPDVAFRPVVEQPIREAFPEPKPVEFVPVKEAKRDIFEGASFGDEFINRVPVTVGKVVSRPKVEQPTPEPIVIPSFQGGENVWHPDLGLCRIHSVDEKANLITLRVHNQDLEVELVLSHAKSKLQLADQAPEHVPVKAVKREQVRIDSKPAPRDVSVVLPPEFNSWSLASKYHFLAHNQHLTAEEANDVFAVLDGKSPLLHKVEINWAELEVLPGQKDFVLDAEGTVPDEIPVGTRVWYPELGACTVDFVNRSRNEIGFVFEDGKKITVTLSQIKPMLVPLSDGDVPAAKKTNMIK